MRRAPLAGRQTGFTLLELLMAGVLTAILAALALPSFAAQIHKGRRADAYALAVQVLQAQERYRSVHTAYAHSAAALGLPPHSADGHYGYELEGISGQGFTLRIRPLAGGAQASDPQCSEFKLVLWRGHLTRSASGKGGDTSAPCWPR